eukprot:GHVQ01006580.1.p1 GENE.GHVQ01006580.1~~GHVQ01006580.1.p1  ORF type:complete len:284 (-),score=32.37 GHVQ01006580.1:362-1213(-)
MGLEALVALYRSLISPSDIPISYHKVHGPLVNQGAHYLSNRFLLFLSVLCIFAFSNFILFGVTHVLSIEQARSPRDTSTPSFQGNAFRLLQQLGLTAGFRARTIIPPETRFLVNLFIQSLSISQSRSIGLGDTNVRMRLLRAVAKLSVNLEGTMQGGGREREGLMVEGGSIVKSSNSSVVVSRRLRWGVGTVITLSTLVVGMFASLASIGFAVSQQNYHNSFAGDVGVVNVARISGLSAWHVVLMLSKFVTGMWVEVLCTVGLRRGWGRGGGLRGISGCAEFV